MLKMSRLPGRAVKRFGWSLERHQLWLSGEYLLHREISGYREEVKRYYYGDIQAIVSGPSLGFRTCNILCLLVLSLLSLLALAMYLTSASVTAYTLVFLGAGLSGFTLSGNLIFGPTCKTTLYTATSEAQLYSLGRRRSTEKAIARILPFIEAAQGAYAAPTPSTEPVEFGGITSEGAVPPPSLEDPPNP